MRPEDWAPGTTTCERCGVEPFTWFQDVLARIPAHSILSLSELLAHNWKPLASSPQL
jgi:hypothetical protein